MPAPQQEPRFNNDSLAPSSALFIALIAVALLSALFYGKVNAEYLGISGLSLTAAFSIAIFSGRSRDFDKNTLPLLLMFLFWGWIGVATIYSPATFISLGTFWSIAFLPCAAFSTILMLEKNKVEEALKIVLFLIITAFTIYSVFMFLVFDLIPRATFANKNNFAALQIPMAFFAATASITTARTGHRVFFLALTGLFVFSIGIIGSRAVIICLAIGFTLILALLIKDQWSRKSLATLATIILVSLTSAELIGPATISETSQVFTSPSSADNGRFVIWKGSFELAKETPWHGTGPGLFFQNYSKHRLDQDKSAGFYVHNDYFQFFIEAGWPAPLILLASLTILTILSARKILSRQTSRDQRVALLTVLMGLGAIAGHSLLSFNFFLTSLLLVMGILLGLTIHQLQSLDGPQKVTAKGNRLSRPTCIIFLLLALIPASFYFDLGRSGLFQKQSEAYRSDGQLADAIKSLEKASSASPGSDFYHYSLAGLWLLKSQETGATPTSTELKSALERLQTAENLNPLRPHTHVIRGRILETFKLPRLSAGSGEHRKLAEFIESEYEKALRKNPFYLDARFYLARFLLKQNRVEEGLTILERGLSKSYPYESLTVNYYRLTAEIRRIAGDEAGYERLMNRLKTAVDKRRKKRRQ
jgi:O-antigen ligase